jgi:hypothetical protein
MRRQRQKEPLFQIGRYWVDRVSGRRSLYRFWYDAGTGELGRRSLETTDLDEAKVRLASFVLQEGTGRASEPKDVNLLTVLTRYYEEHSDRRPNPAAARRAGGLILDFLGNTAKVTELTRARQTGFIRHLHAEKLSVAYISRIQAVIAAALNRAVAFDDDDAAALLTRTPKILVQPRTIAELLDAPEPTPKNWHPDVAMLARFIDAIPPEDHTRLLRFTLLTLVFGRPEAVRELTPFQIDERYRLVALNAEGRRQTKKHRATLPMPDALWETLLSWREGATIVHTIRTRKRDDGATETIRVPVNVLRKPWAEARARAGLPGDFVPKSLRHMLATELRRRRVPKEDRELWQGHRRLSTNDRYGQFDPDFLASAKAAVDALLRELDAACETTLFRTGSSDFRHASDTPTTEAPTLRIVK